MSYYPNVFTVSFFGHAQYDNFEEVEANLKKEIEKVLIKHDAVVFLIGRWGGFDISAAYWVRFLKEKYRDSFIRILLKIPSNSLTLRAARTPYQTKAEIGYRYTDMPDPNAKAKMRVIHQYMVDDSDYIICCLQKDKGNTYKTIQYAKLQNKKIKNVGTDPKNDPIKLMK